MKKLLPIILAISLLVLPFQHVAALDFNPNYLISDEEILNSGSMSSSEIQRFLDSKTGLLKSYLVSVDVADEPYRELLAAEYIYYISQKTGINPKFLLVLLQKEQSLITEENPTARNLDFATGYGCPDSGSCSERWRGIAKQINSAALQFKDYMENPQDYHYQVGGVYTFSDYGQVNVVTPTTVATAGLYNYTPHVYNGNYNFWKLWNEWFSLAYPDGSLLQAKGDPVVYLVKYGLKRPFKSRAALATRYSLNKIIQVEQSVIDQYPTGDPIKYPQYALYRSPKGTVYLIVDDVKHGFTSQQVMKDLGINPEEIEDLDQASIDEITEGSPISIASAYPMGALLQNRESGTVYWVKDGKKYGIISPDILRVNFGSNSVINQVDSDQLKSYVAMPPLLIQDGELITSNNPEKPAVYVISDGLKHPILSGESFEALGYKWENILSVEDHVVELHPTGEPIDTIN